jgi:RNA polymerase sigma factor (sigma-70 family)
MEPSDSELVEKTKAGDIHAATDLVKRYEAKILNLALRMTGNYQDSEDATQEIMMKMLTKLSAFAYRSSYSTWLYSIAINHLLSMRRSCQERTFYSFEQHKAFIDSMNYLDEIPDSASTPEEQAIINSIKMQCTIGMLLCLDRNLRVVFILSFLFALSSKDGSLILKIDPATYRQQLHRARSIMKKYMRANCGAIRNGNSCSCARVARRIKTRGAANNPLLDGNEDLSLEIQLTLAKVEQGLESRSFRRIQEVFTSSPFLDSSCVSEHIRELIPFASE